VRVNRLRSEALSRSPEPPAAARRPDLEPFEAADAVAATALGLRGTPYRNGGTDPSGFDCSGFTQYVFGRVGIALPRAVREQFASGREIPSDRIAAGDLVFFSTTEPGPSHVGIAIDATQFVHAPSSTGVVRVERLAAGYWARRYLGARRVRRL
jgi:cell wall-associated NlpC family hydrolase